MIRLRDGYARECLDFQEKPFHLSATEQKWTGVLDLEGGLKTVFSEDIGPLRTAPDGESSEKFEFLFMHVEGQKQNK